MEKSDVFKGAKQLPRGIRPAVAAGFDTAPSRPHLWLLQRLGSSKPTPSTNESGSSQLFAINRTKQSNDGKTSESENPMSQAQCMGRKEHPFNPS